MIANEIVGEKYIFNENNKQVFNNLLLYFLGLHGEYDLNKGISLVGTYGCGKSTIFQIFHTFLKRLFPFNQNMFRITSVEEIINDSQKQNFIDSVNLYNVKQNPNGIETRKPIHILVNEFGHQYGKKDFGTDVNENINFFLMKRYDIFQQNNKVTHITTNYDTSQMKSMFHERIVDRFKEMFNLIELKGNSFRK